MENNKQELKDLEKDFPLAQFNDDYCEFLLSIYNGRTEAVEKLLNSGKCNAKDNIINGNNTVLMLCACRGRQEIMPLLLGSGADIDAQNANGYTAAMYAVKNLHKEVLEILIKNKANLNTIGKDGQTVLSIAINLAAQEDDQSTSMEIILLLLRAGVDWKKYTKDLLSFDNEEINKFITD